MIFIELHDDSRDKKKLLIRLDMIESVTQKEDFKGCVIRAKSFELYSVSESIDVVEQIIAEAGKC